MPTDVKTLIQEGAELTDRALDALLPWLTGHAAVDVELPRYDRVSRRRADDRDALHLAPHDAPPPPLRRLGVVTPGVGAPCLRPDHG